MRGPNTPSAGTPRAACTAATSDPWAPLESTAVSVPESLAVPLRGGEPAVVGRLESGRLLLDLRSVPEVDDERLTDAILAAPRGDLP